MRALIGALVAYLPYVCVAGGIDISQTSDQPGDPSSCLGTAAVYNADSTVKIESIPVSPGITLTDDKPVITSGGVVVDLVNQTISGSGVTFDSIGVTGSSINVTGTPLGSGVALTNNASGTVTFTNLNVSSEGPAGSRSQDSDGSTTETMLDPSAPAVLYDPSSGEISFTRIRNASSSRDRSVGIFLESSFPAFRYCTTDRGNANVFILGNRSNPIFAATDQDFLLWYYDDAASLPETLQMGKIVEPGTPAEVLNFLYWTSDLEFTFPFDRQAALTGSITVIPEPHSLVLSTFALLGVALMFRCRR